MEADREVELLGGQRHHLASASIAVTDCPTSTVLMLMRAEEALRPQQAEHASSPARTRPRARRPQQAPRAARARRANRPPHGRPRAAQSPPATCSSTVHLSRRGAVGLRPAPSEARASRLSTVSDWRRAVRPRSAAADHQRTVAQRCHLLEIRRHHQDRRALVRATAQQRVDRDTWRRYRRPAVGSSMTNSRAFDCSQRPTNTFCWLPPLSQSISALGSRGRTSSRSERRGSPRRSRAGPVRRQALPRRRCPDCGSRFSCTDMPGKRALAPAVPGQQRDAAGDALGDAVARAASARAVEANLARHAAGGRRRSCGRSSRGRRRAARPARRSRRRRPGNLSGPMSPERSAATSSTGSRRRPRRGGGACAGSRRHGPSMSCTRSCGVISRDRRGPHMAAVAQHGDRDRPGRTVRSAGG